MRFVPVLVFLLAACRSLAALPDYDWQWVNPLPQGRSLHSYCVVNENTIFAAGEGGVVLRSQDGGETWTLLDTGTETYLEDVHFTDPMTGTAVGEWNLEGVILRTEDGGVTWRRQQLEWTMNWLEAVDFIDSQTGVIVGQGGTILWTVDGGENWNDQTQVTDQWLKGVQMLDSQTAVAVGQGGTIIRTTNGGQTWLQEPSPTDERLWQVTFRDSLNGLACGDEGMVLRTWDGGHVWYPRPTPADAWLYDVAYRDDDVAVAVGTTSTLQVSSDGGSTWESQPAPLEQSWGAAAFTTQGRMLLTGSYGNLWRDAGDLATWTNSQTGWIGMLYKAAEAGPDTVVAVGYDGLILRSTDGGVTWSEIPSGTDVILSAVDMTTTGKGLITGQFGQILRSTDTGLSWDPVTTGYEDWLNGVAWIDGQTAVAVGNQLSILRTTDSGETWEQVHSGSSYDYHNAVFFTDELYGWTCTWYGRVFHTRDGGLTWTEQIFTGLDLNDICFTDRLHGLSVGGVDGNRTLITDDGGLTWDEIPNPDNVYLYGVAFFDRDHGITVGQGIYHTSDAVASWQFDRAYDLWCFDVCLLESGAALAVGRGAGILRTAPAEVNPVPDTPAAEPILMRAYPNPFNPRTTIAYRVPRTGQVTVQVFDVGGHLVATLVDELQPAGGHEVTWHGTTAAGRPAPSGTYFARLLVDGRPVGQAARMSLVK